MSRRWLAILALAVVGLLTACPPVCSCPPLPPSQVTVTGVVTDAADAPLENADIAAVLREATCTTNEPGTAELATTTDATGHFSLIVFGYSTDSVCVRLRASPNGAPQDSIVVSARTLLGPYTGTPGDSLHFTIHLP